MMTIGPPNPNTGLRPGYPSLRRESWSTILVLAAILLAWGCSAGYGGEDAVSQQGCVTNDDCKGTRICVDGTCVFPDVLKGRGDAAYADASSTDDKDLPPACIPSCDGKECGTDYCGGQCGQCGAPAVCNKGKCLESCFSTCEIDECVCGEVCGDACGECPDGLACFDSCACGCAPSCDGKECGGDGCGGTCGTCGQGLDCEGGTCVCVPQCEGKDCGDDGCGGKCGSCGGLTAQCVEQYCDYSDGLCKLQNTTPGNPCDDGNKCTLYGECHNGLCVGSGNIKCDDGAECTADSCEPDEGCIYAPVEDGSECDDGSLCTTDDHCESGQCVGDPAEECNGCGVDDDCHVFEDGNLCNGTLKCIEDKCVVDADSVIVCEIPEAGCMESKCNPATGECVIGEMLDGSPCDDSSVCTEQDYCSGGDCQGLPIDCDDDNACTTEDCDPDMGCVYENNEGSCDDGSPCTLDDHCQAGVCAGEPTPGCVCDGSADCEELEDGDLCNGTLICEEQQCILDPATVVDCDSPGLDACATSSCEPATGFCFLMESPDGTKCDDKSNCTVDDLCFEGICKGLPVYCDDGNVCTDDSCDPIVGCFHGYNTADCDDGSMCSLNDYCDGGLCTGDPNPDCICQDDDDCLGFEDGDLCNGTLACKGFKCVVDQESIVVCDNSGDSDCLVSSCQPDSGACIQTAYKNGRPCNDFNACTLIDMCIGGVCNGAIAPYCDDLNECTIDSCDPQLGCIAVPNADTCENGDSCTGGDTCDDGLCQPGDLDLCGGDTCLPDRAISCGDSEVWGTGMNGFTNVVADYACNGLTYPGYEYTYIFTAPYDGGVTVSLSDEEADTELIVLENMGDGCDPEQCLDLHLNQVTFEAVEGSIYYFVVDSHDAGLEPPEPSYVIEVECEPHQELACGDGADDDMDGLTDCDDDDCFGTEACSPSACEPAWKLACGDSETWGNYLWGSTNNIDDYPCTNWVYEGPEYTYVFVAPVSKPITVVLTEETAETDLLVLQATDQLICDPDACVATGFSEVTFDAVAGTTYYLVVDGWAGAEGSYTITVDCPPDVEFDCSDDMDNDEDGATDCDDDDCALADACAVDCNPGSGALTVECGFGEDWYNFGYDSTNKANDYACTGDDLSGPEVSYTFTTLYDGEVIVSLSEETAETELLIVEDAGDKCVVENCIAHDQAEVTFNAKAGGIYHLVVDGQEGATGAYHIAVTCAP